MYRKKEIAEHLYEYEVACSYEELKRFRSSVPCNVSEKVNQNILKPHTYGLVQAVSNNFDYNILFMDGITHFRVLLMLETGGENCE